MGWIRIRMDPKLLPGSGSGTLKIQSWIWNKSFWIYNTGNEVKVVLRSHLRDPTFPPKETY